MKKFTVEVTMAVEVTLDETKFDQAFCTEFNNYITYMGDADDPYTLEEHAKNLAQLEARGMPTYGIVEGYGEVEDMGIKVAEAQILDMNIVGVDTIQFAT